MRYLRLLRLVAMAVAAAAGVLLVTHYQALLDQTTRLLALQLSAWLGEEITIANLEVHPWDLAVTARGIRASSQRPGAEPTIVEIPLLTARLAAIPTSERVHIRSIEIDRPDINLSFKDGVLEDFAGVAPGAGGEFEKAASPRLDIDRIVVHSASIRASDDTAGWRAAIAGLDLEMSLVAGRPRQVVVSDGRVHFVSGEVDETVESLAGRIVLSSSVASIRTVKLVSAGIVVTGSGSATLGDGPGDSIRLRLDVAADADLASFRNIVPDIPAMAGHVSFSGGLEYGRSLRVAGSVAFSDVAIDGFAVGDGEATVTVTPEGIEVPDGRLDRSRGTITFGGSVGFGERLPMRVHAGLSRVHLADLFEAVSLSDPWVDAGLSGAIRVEGFLEGPVELKGDLSLAGTSLRVWDESFRTARPESLVLSLDEVAIGASVAIDESRVRVTRARIETPGSSLFIDGTIGFDETMALAFDAVRLDLSEVCPLAGFEIAGKGWGKGTMRGPFAALLIEADLRLFGAEFDGYLLGEVAGRFVAPLASARFLVSRMEGAGDGLRAIGSPNQPLPREDAALDTLATALLGLGDTYYQGQLAKQDPALLMVPRATLTIGDTRADGSMIVVFGSPMTIYGNVSVSSGGETGVPEGQLADLLRVAGVEFPEGAVEGTVFGHATVHGDPLALDGSGRAVLTMGTVYGQPVDRAEVRFRMDGGSLIVDDLAAGLGDGRLFASARLGAGGEIEASAILEGLPLEALNALSAVPLQGRVDADIVLGGSWNAPQVAGSIMATNVGYAGVRLEDSVVTLAMVEDTLEIQGIVSGRYGRIQAAMTMTGDLPYSMTLELDDIPLDPFLELGVDDAYSASSRASGVVWASGELAGDAPAHIIVQFDDFSLNHAGFSLGLAEPTTLELYHERWSLAPMHVIGDDTDLLVTGAIAADDSVSMALSGYFDLFFLDALLPGLFQRLDGRLTFAGHPQENGREAFLVKGTTDALEFDGEAVVSNAAISTEYFPPTIDQLDARIVLGDGNVVEITELAGQVGGGTLAGRGRMVLGPGYYPRFYDLEVHAKDAFVQYLADLPPGLMDADLAFHGPVGNLLMSGEVSLKRMVYRERYNWEKYLTDFRTYRLEDLEIVDEEPPAFAIDIRIHAPGTFYIRNNLGQMQFKGDLQVAGDTNVVELYGDIESVRGTVTLLDNTFELTQAKIEFTGDYWNPSLDIRMQTQIQSYTIYYLVTGTLEDWQLVPGSDSGLSERDINSLIAFGTLADNITEGNEARAVAAPALEFLIGRLGVLEQLQAFTRLDRFTIIPASDEAGNIGARVYGEKELIQEKLFFSGYYDYAVNGSQAYLMDLEWRTFNCCSLILRLDGSDTVGATSVRPGLRLKLKLELE